MAKGFCLVKELADKLKALAIKGEINIAEMYDMTSQQRNDLFSQWVDSDTAQKINAGFEEAMISDQQNALRTWAKNTFGGSTKTKTKADIYDKIDRLKELGVLDPKNSEAFLSDLVATKLGAAITAEEAAKISEKAAKIEALSGQVSEFGTPTLEYFKAKKDMEDYLNSLNPSSRLKVATSIIGRGSMLFSFKSPLVNIESNTVQAFLTAAERRLATGQFGSVNGEYAREYMKFVNRVFKETGYDVSRMRTLKADQKVRGEEITTSEGKGKVRATGRFYEDIVFKKLMATPDVAFSSFHFADSANLASTKIAQLEGKSGSERKTRALEIFKDATKIDPQTPEGKKVREQAMADAEYATYTNESLASKFAIGVRTLLNNATGDARLGDQVMPFVKTPANVVWSGIEFSGAALPIDALYRLGKTVRAIRSGETFTDAAIENFAGLNRHLIRSGLGTVLAAIISSLFKPEDFIGEYPVSQKEQELLKMRNATPNSVKIGNKWVSLDYLGVLGTPIVGMLYAKKYGKNTGSAMYNYYVGVGRQAAKIPGLEVGSNLFDLLSATAFGEGDRVKESLQKGAVDYVRSRTIPAFLYDIAKGTDQYERDTSGNPFNPVKGSVPGLREELPIKRTVLGGKMTGEGILSTMLFGSRLKTAKESPAIAEIVRLSSTGNLPSVTDFAKTSSRFKELKVQIGEEKFREASAFLGESLNTAFEKEIKTGSYKKLTDEKKAEALNSIKDEVAADVLRKYHYKAKKGLK